ncbi:MAG: hypothetical protein AAGA55_02065 [Planctomycetota bacterium]
MPAENLYRLVMVAAFALPVAAVGVARYIGSAAEPALAAVAAAPPVLPTLTQPAAQQPLPDHPFRSPFWTRASVSPYQPDPEIPGEVQVSEPPPSIDARLTAVMPSSRTPLAVINGKPHRIGDAVTPTWTLVSIDGKARTVTLRNSNGQTVTIALSR